MRDTENVPGTGNPVVTLVIEDIAMIDELQVREKTDNATVNRYMAVIKDGGTMPLPKVAKVNDGYLLVDGWHRIEAMKRLGYPQLEVEVVAWSMKDAMAHASTVNSAHGLRLKKKEYRKALWLYVKGNRHIKGKYGAIKSLKEIKEELKADASRSTIRTWLMEDHPKIHKAMSKENKGDDENSFTKYRGNRNHTVYGTDKPHRKQFDNLRSTLRTIHNRDERVQMADELEQLAHELRQGEIPMKPLPCDDF